MKGNALKFSGISTAFAVHWEVRYENLGKEGERLPIRGLGVQEAGFFCMALLGWRGCRGDYHACFLLPASGDGMDFRMQRRGDNVERSNGRLAIRSPYRGADARRADTRDLEGVWKVFKATNDDDLTCLYPRTTFWSETSANAWRSWRKEQNSLSGSQSKEGVLEAVK